MATRELAEIKDKNGDVNELRDKKLADSVAKNTVVNTDNVRMVDTNGKEVFIARDSFISAIRNVLGGFILSNTKAEAPNIPVFDSNGDFGAITAANLASVLGGGMKVTGAVGESDTYDTDMLMSDYSYVIALAYDKTKKANTCYFKLSKLTLDNNTISEEIQAEVSEAVTLNVHYYKKNNGCIQIKFSNGIGFGLLFGVK